MIGLFPRKAGHFTRHAQDLLLKEQHPTRAVQDRLQRRMQVGDALLAAIATNEMRRHTAGGRPRLEEGIRHSQVAHGARSQLAQRALGASRFTLKDTYCLAAHQQVGGGRIVRRQIGQREMRVAIAAHQVGGVRQHRQGTDAQQVQLGQADSRYIFMIVLSHQETLGRPLHWHVVRKDARRDHNTPRMHAEMVGLAHQQMGEVHGGTFALVTQLAQDLLRIGALAAARVRMPGFRQQAHQAVNGFILQAQCLARFTHRRTQTQGADGRHQRHVVGAIGAAHIVEHFIATPAAKIKVNIGQCAARRIEKALEQQVVRQGIDGGDIQAVGDEAVGDAAARADRDVIAPSKGHDVGHDQEKRSKAALVDRCQFVRQALRRNFVSPIAGAIMAGGAGSGAVSQDRFGALPRRQREHRPHGAAVRGKRFAAFQQLAGGSQRLRQGSKTPRHFVRLQPVQIDRFIAAMPCARRQLVQQAVAFDGSQHAQRRAIFRLQAIDWLHSDRLHTKLLPQGVQLLGYAEIGRRVHFEAEPALGVKKTGVTCQQVAGAFGLAGAQGLFKQAAPPAAQAGEAIAVRCQIRPTHAALYKLFALRVRLQSGREAAERTVAGGVARQQHDPIRLSFALFGSHGERHSRHRLHTGPGTGAGKGNHAIEAVAVGQRQPLQPLGCGASSQGAYWGRRLQQAKVRMDVERRARGVHARKCPVSASGSARSRSAAARIIVVPRTPEPSEISSSAVTLSSM